MIDYYYDIKENDLKTMLRFRYRSMFRHSVIMMIAAGFCAYVFSFYFWILGGVAAGAYLIFQYFHKAKLPEVGLQRGGVAGNGTFFLEEYISTESIPYGAVSYYYLYENMLIIHGTAEAGHRRLIFFKEGFGSQEAFSHVLTLLEKGINGHKGYGAKINWVKLIRRYLSGG